MPSESARRSLGRWLACLVLGWLAVVPMAQAHEARPAYLELKETGPGQFSVLWRTPVLAGRRLPVALKLPDGVRNVRAPERPGTRRLAGRAALDRRRAGRTRGQAHRVPRASSSRSPMCSCGWNCWTAAAGPRSRARRSRGSRSRPRSRPWQVAGNYIVEGIRHILFGADHLLFVLGLLLIVRNGWMLVKTITAFTVAHSITLAAATLGYANVPAPPRRGGDRAQHPVPRPGDRPALAGRDELHHPQSLGGGLRVRPAARLRLRQRTDERRAARVRTFRWRCSASTSGSSSASSGSSGSC